MDLLKTLLFYMIITTSGAAVDAGVTPIPYDVLNTPAPIVTPTQPPTPTLEPTATPAPTLPPVTLYEGRLGTHVRMLQQLLYDLGYLNTQPDGAFGEKTKEAVEEFQRRNNLEADGIAGPKTIEKLYDENVVKGARFDPATPTPSPTPSLTPTPTQAPTATPTVAPTQAPTAEPATAAPAATATPTVAPTATPTPTVKIVAVDVDVLYKCGDKIITSMVLTLDSNAETPIYPAAALIPDDYELVDTAPVLVKIDAVGNASPKTVEFKLQEKVEEVNVKVEYRYADSLILYYEVSAVPGVTLVSPASSLLPSGYSLIDPSAVTAPQEGEVIVFQLQRSAAYYISVLYQDASGAVLAQELRMIYEGSNTIAPQASLIPSNYTVDASQKVTVTVDADGIFSPTSVVFICQPQ